MKLKQFFTDDDAVSPVIGVILMVAITVILAAVIASFVLGLGQSTGNTAPSITFSEDYDSDTPSLTISVTNVGDTVEAGDVYLRGTGDGATLDQSLNNYDGSTNAESELTAGMNFVVDSPGPGSAYDIDVIYDPGDGDSSTLTTFTGPDA
ncbi:type IV pilin [Halapricum salinum]|uniref:Type IV pilin n=1 Tax=Halapricum salinum TaxID=1457250 RepID=A0A4D6HIA0_9EURY|nr:type IV pilin N-terminal domain-containing protein [Halapricum salinum]QCC52956.1 type IV pilin [Halapricum salinum]